MEQKQALETSDDGGSEDNAVTTDTIVSVHSARVVVTVIRLLNQINHILYTSLKYLTPWRELQVQGWDNVHRSQRGVLRLSLLC